VDNSLVKSELLAEYYPQILCDYYESHLKFQRRGKGRQPKHRQRKY